MHMCFQLIFNENGVLSTETQSIRYMAKSMLSRLREAADAQKGCWSAD